MKKVLFIQHGDVDKPGLLAEVLAELGIELTTRHPYAGDSLPVKASGFDGLALGGGGQSAYETDLFPYLDVECALVKAALQAGKPVIGLCLGGQLISRALGGVVRRAEQKELGFFPVTRSAASQGDPVGDELPAVFHPAHWHGDVFSIPEGAVHLASSALTPNQMFRYGTNCYGFQFHLEMTAPLFEELVRDSAAGLAETGVDCEALVREGYEVLPFLEKNARAALARWAAFL